MGWLNILNPKVAKKVKSVLVKDKASTITAVRPGSGKIPPWIGAGKNLEDRAKIARTHHSLERSKKVDAAVKKAKEGKEELKHMEATGQAEELRGYKDKRTGIWHKKGFNR